jgi:hypothetical protein
LTNLDGVDVTQVIHGYDIFHTNEFDRRGDPGYRNGRIFMPDCHGYSIIFDYYRDFLTISPNYYCNGEFSSTTYRTVRGYSQGSQATIQHSFGLSIGFGGGYQNSLAGFGFDINAEFGFDITRRGEFDNKLGFLRNMSGEIVVAKAECSTHEVSIAMFSRPRFSSGFITALFMINASLSENTQKQIDIYTQFVREYGTHFIRRAKLGASLTYEKMFYKVSSSSTQESRRKACLGAAVSTCIGAEFFADAAGLEANIKVCIEGETEGCIETSNEQAATSANEEETVSIYSKGSKPRQLDEWTSSEFNPVPTLLELEDIPSLLTENNLSKNYMFGFVDSLDAPAIRAFFEKYNKIYCEKVLGLSPEECGAQLTGKTSLVNRRGISSCSG